MKPSAKIDQLVEQIRSRALDDLFDRTNSRTISRQFLFTQRCRFFSFPLSFYFWIGDVADVFLLRLENFVMSLFDLISNILEDGFQAISSEK